MNPELFPTADGTRLAVRRYAGTGNLIVALHGFTGDGSTMMELVESCRGGRPALVIDLVGHGASDAPDVLEPYSMGSVVDQVLSLIGPHEPATVHLLGYSMGGRVALSMAARAPWYFGSITTISATPGIDDPGERSTRYDADQERAAHLEAVGLDTFIDEWLSLQLFAPYVARLGDEALAATRQQRVGNSVLGLANSLRATGTGSMPPLWTALSSVLTPVLALAGEHDQRYVNIAKRVADIAPRGQFHVVPDAGHVAHVENCGEVATRIAHFLEVCEGDDHLGLLLDND